MTIVATVTSNVFLWYPLNLVHYPIKSTANTNRNNLQRSKTPWSSAVICHILQFFISPLATKKLNFKLLIPLFVFSWVAQQSPPLPRIFGSTPKRICPIQTPTHSESSLELTHKNMKKKKKEKQLHLTWMK